MRRRFAAAAAGAGAGAGAAAGGGVGGVAAAATLAASDRCSAARAGKHPATALAADRVRPAGKEAKNPCHCCSSAAAVSTDTAGSPGMSPSHDLRSLRIEIIPRLALKSG